MIAIGTAHLDEYCNLLQVEADVKIVEQIKDKAWGYRQSSIRDLDDNRLILSRCLEGGNRGGSGGIDRSEISGAVVKERSKLRERGYPSADVRRM
jgi:hypothetical protein